MKHLLITLLALTLAIPGKAQFQVLDEYVKIGIQNNLKVEQQRLTVEQSLKTLNEARGGLIPNLDFNSRYTRATGGREFAIPTGDLVNPIHMALNNIMGEENFPMIDNQVLDFNRQTDIDTRFTLSQPLYDRSLWMQKKAASEASKAQFMAFNTSKRDMARDIKVGYYNYLKALKVQEVLEATKEVIEENLRVAESLKANDKVTQDVVWRAKSDISGIEYQLADAIKDIRVSQSYFNLLLNRPLTSPIVAIEIEGQIPSIDSVSVDPSRREEWQQLEYGKQAAEYEKKFAAAQTLPTLYAALDYGFQGTEYVFNTESDYVLGSFVLQWNIFNGYRTKSQKQRIQLEKQKLEAQQQELELSIQFEQLEAQYEFDAAAKNRVTAADREKDALETWRLIERKYKEGLATQVEQIDARNNLIRAALQKIITHYDLWIAYASYERAVAGFDIDNF